jgi:hypothetical protein
MISRSCIENFLDHFNYLDANGNRKGSPFFFWFNNKKLTQDNVANAGELKKALTALKDDDQGRNDTVLAGEFLAAVEKAMARVRQARLDCAAPRRVTTDENGVSHCHKTPYKAALFEHELLNGLGVMVKRLTEIIDWRDNASEKQDIEFSVGFRDNCKDLIKILEAALHAAPKEEMVTLQKPEAEAAPASPSMSTGTG